MENNIRGGLSVVSNRYAKVKNSYTEDGLNKTQRSSYICYLDANNLYSYAMWKHLFISSRIRVAMHTLLGMFLSA